VKTSKKVSKQFASSSQLIAYKGQGLLLWRHSLLVEPRTAARIIDKSSLFVVLLGFVRHAGTAADACT
jgi:hypothetical protein